MIFDSKTNKMRITSHDEILKVIRALNFYSRIWMGQYLEIDNEITWLKKEAPNEILETKITSLLLKIRSKLLPLSNRDIGQTLYASYGIFSNRIDERAGTAYDMQQVIRYTLAWFLHPEGGWTVDFGSPLRAGRVYPVPKASCVNNDGNIEMEVSLTDKSQFIIVEDAIEILNLVCSGKIEKLFSHYTDDKEALLTASEIEKVYAKIQ